MGNSEPNRMYLHDYQRHQLKKMRRGGNFILHGSRGVGITAMLLNHALTHISDSPGGDVCVVSKDPDDIPLLIRTVFDYIHAAKTGNVSVFDRSLHISSQPNKTLNFSNGSTIGFFSSNSLSQNMRECDLLILDRAGDYGLNSIKDRIRAGALVAGTTGGFNKNSDIYRLYINSLRGKNDFEYIRLPWELSPNLRESCNKIYNGMPPPLWFREFELHSYID